MVISDEHYRAIGRISVMFSDVETWTSSFIWQLVGPDQYVGQMITAGMSFSRQLDLLTSLFRHRFSDPALQLSLETLVRRLSELEQQRNAILHSTWVLMSTNRSEATRFKITASRKRGLHQIKETTRPEDLDAVAAAFETALGEFCDFMIPLVSTLT